MIVSFAAFVSTTFAAEPFAGTWRFSTEKSRCTDNPNLRPETLIIEPDGNGLRFTTKTTDREGRPQERVQTLALDGAKREGQSPGRNPRGTPFDMLSSRRAGDRTIDLVYYKGEKEVGSGRYEMSAGDKTMLFNRKTITEAGGKHEDNFVYERQ